MYYRAEAAGTEDHWERKQKKYIYFFKLKPSISNSMPLHANGTLKLAATMGWTAPMTPMLLTTTALCITQASGGRGAGQGK